MTEKLQTENPIYSILKQVSSTSISLGDFTFTKEQKKNNWIGNAATSIDTISQVEKRLNIILPHDYKNFLLVSDGFHASNSVEPSFLSEIHFFRKKLFQKLICKPLKKPTLKKIV